MSICEACAGKSPLGFGYSVVIGVDREIIMQDLPS